MTKIQRSGDHTRARYETFEDACADQEDFSDGIVETCSVTGTVVCARFVAGNEICHSKCRVRTKHALLRCDVTGTDTCQLSAEGGHLCVGRCLGHRDA